ncbi:DUF6907 domain-containing protein [Actinomadura decatromicini]|uniref:Uncharacterized protein n=1 Tax=Actinomadura decatromicini TaxID=2604572 RepID=A0A5D3F9F4_9ACTN|nr:hypothetical protein [Actinomadura decatromicini]TYK44466.1 hypothetical protein FXF68_33900 [Actinomadura decatromicini]
MPVASKNACAQDQRCPRWCTLDHSGTRTALLHESEAQGLPLSHRHDVRLPESVDLRVVQYGPDEPGEDAVPPSVELTYHVGSRYRVIGLSAGEARRLAGILLACAAHADDTSG